MGNEVTLDQGHLSWTNVMLTAYSAAFPVTAVHTYQFTGQVTGALVVSLEQGGRVTAMYGNGETLLWQNPANFSGTATVQQTFTGNDEGAPTRLALTANLAAGHLSFGGVGLQHLATGDTIRRSTDMLAGQAVATRVSGDPVSGNNGISYFYNDHLGSNTALRKPDGSRVSTYYLPFGNYRGAAPNQTITDRDFTGQPQNRAVGLLYYQARFYVPGVGRFASADTLVPDPTNPQQYNRYSYVLNNPIVLVDPTGNFSEGAIWGHIYSDICASDLTCTYDTLASWQQNAEWWDMLLAAEAGDVLFVSGGRHFRFLGDGRIRLDGIIYSEFNGAYNAGWQTNDGFFNLTLQELFSGTDQNVWGGRYRVQGGSIVSIHYRPSTVTEWYLPGRKPYSESVSEAIAAGLVAGAACARLGAGMYSVVCSGIASGATAAYNAFPPLYSLDPSEALLVSAGHAHVYERRRMTFTEDNQAFPGSPTGYVRIYGPNAYIALQRSHITVR